MFYCLTLSQARLTYITTFIFIQNIGLIWILELWIVMLVELWNKYRQRNDLIDNHNRQSWNGNIDWWTYNFTQYHWSQHPNSAQWETFPDREIWNMILWTVTVISSSTHCILVYCTCIASTLYKVATTGYMA